MWRYLAFVLWMVACGASEGWAQIWVDVHQNGDAWLHNVGASALTFDGYQILDVTGQGRLRHENLRSVESLIAAGKVGDVLNTLGAGALGFTEAGLSPNSVAELTAGAGGTLQPGATWYLGPIFPPIQSYPSWEGFECSFNTGGAIQQAPCPYIICEPTSGTLGLLGVIATSMLLVRRRK
jgi:hypothetical protein